MKYSLFITFSIVFNWLSSCLIDKFIELKVLSLISAYKALLDVSEIFLYSVGTSLDLDWLTNFSGGTQVKAIK